MAHRISLVVFVLLLILPVLPAADSVGVSGSNNTFETSIESKVNGKKIKLKLTGTALRTRLIFNVYAIGSYVESSQKVRTPEELSALDAPKQMHLIMERDISGTDVANAFSTAIRANYAAPEFAAELEMLTTYLAAQSIKQGDHVWLTHIPGQGMHVLLVGKKEQLIKNPRFSRAVWDIYFGPNNLGDTIKKGLSSRL